MARMWPDCLLLHSTTMIQASRVAKSRRDTLLLNISRFFRPNCLKYFPNSVKILITINCSLSFFLLQFCIGAFPISLFATPGPSVRPITLRAVWHKQQSRRPPYRGQCFISSPMFSRPRTPHVSWTWTQFGQRQICSLLSHRLFDQLNVTYFLGETIFSGTHS